MKRFSEKLFEKTRDVPDPVQRWIETRVLIWNNQMVYWKCLNGKNWWNSLIQKLKGAK